MAKSIIDEKYQILDPQVWEFYHEKIENRAFYVPGAGIEDLRRGADKAFNDQKEITDIAFWEDRTLYFGGTVTGTPRFFPRPDCQSCVRMATPILEAAVPDMKVRIFRPVKPEEQKGKLPVVLYFHGGGFVIHNIASHDALTRKLAKSWNAVVISAEYRLAPEYRHPAAMQDGWALLCYVRDHAEELGIDPSKIILSGDSAGATICAVLSRLETVCECGDEDFHPIYAQVGFYGSYGALPDDESESMALFGGGDFVLPRQAIADFTACTLPENYKPGEPMMLPGNGELPAGMPRSIIVSAECDPLRDDGLAYAENLKSVGCDVTSIIAKGMMHGFMLYWHKFRYAEKLIDDIGKLLFPERTEL